LSRITWCGCWKFGASDGLVGGAITILKNMSSSIGRNIPYIMENKTCSKPPTSG
jgi:hypothetical protein